ncbi:MAG: YceI family protein [Pseudomonadota bacterium]
MNGVAKPVALEARLAKAAPCPLGPKEGVPTLGLEATGAVMRSKFELGAFAPAVNDAAALRISVEAAKAEPLWSFLGYGRATSLCRVRSDGFGPLAPKRRGRFADPRAFGLTLRRRASLGAGAI